MKGAAVHAKIRAAEVINEAAELAAMGVDFGKPKIDVDKMRAGKDKVVKKLTTGLKGLAKARKVQVVHGTGRFDPSELAAVGENLILEEGVRIFRPETVRLGSNVYLGHDAVRAAVGYTPSLGSGDINGDGILDVYLGKNEEDDVLLIGDGLGFGTNARASLITRGLAEITRLGLALGAVRVRPRRP